MYYHSDRQFTIDPNDGKEMLVTIKDLGDYTKQAITWTLDLNHLWIVTKNCNSVNKMFQTKLLTSLSLQYLLFYNHLIWYLLWLDCNLIRYLHQFRIWIHLHQGHLSLYRHHLHLSERRSALLHRSCHHQYCPGVHHHLCISQYFIVSFITFDYIVISIAQIRYRYLVDPVELWLLSIAMRGEQQICISLSTLTG